MATRCDRSSKPATFRRTPQGGVRSGAYLTRTGVFLYHVSDGKGGTRPFYELRPEEEVFSEDSLASLAAAPVTVSHPSKPVTPATWKEVSVGHVADSPRRDGIYVAAEVSVQDQAAVESVEDGKLVEFSCGYACRLDMTPGEFEGQKYDAIQRDIRYNHVALLPSGGGRAGSSVRLRADGVDNFVEADLYAESSTMIVPTDKPKDNALLVPDQAKLDAAEGREAAQKNRADAAEALVETLRTRADTADAALVVEKSRADAAETALATERKSREDAITDRLTVVRGAERILGSEFKSDGLSSRDLQLAAIVKLSPSFKADGKSDDFVRGVFETAVASVTDADVKRARLAADLAAGSRESQDKKDAAQETVMEKNQREANERWNKAHNK